MKDKAQIKMMMNENILSVEDTSNPMSETTWSYVNGWIDALKWSLGEDMGTNGGTDAK
tara:strand:+ start:1355 stop:1528 length:174 start_codon:yes stop_codon:yes gene_type:complete